MYKKPNRILVNHYESHLIDIPFDRLKTMLRPGDIIAANSLYACSSETYLITDVQNNYVRAIPDPYFIQDHKHEFMNLKTPKARGINCKIKFIHITGIRFTADIPRIPVTMPRYQKTQLEDLIAIDRHMPEYSTMPNHTRMKFSLATLKCFEDNAEMRKSWYELPHHQPVKITCTEEHIDGVCDCLMTYHEFRLYRMLNHISLNDYLMQQPENTSKYRRIF